MQIIIPGLSNINVLLHVGPMAELCLHGGSGLLFSGCSKCLAPVAAGGASCCQDTCGHLCEWFSTLPCSLLPLSVWFSAVVLEVKLLSFRKAALVGLREQGRASPGMAPTPGPASASMARDCRWAPKSA